MLKLVSQKGGAWIFIIFLMTLIVSLCIYIWHHSTLEKEKSKFQSQMDKLNYHIERLQVEKDSLRKNIDRILAEQELIRKETPPPPPKTPEPVETVKMSEITTTIPDVSKFGGTDMLSLLKKNIEISDELQRAKLKIDEINLVKENLEKQVAILQQKLYARTKAQ